MRAVRRGTVHGRIKVRPVLHRQTGRKERLGMNRKPYSGRLLAGLAAIVLAELYGQALQHAGYNVTFKLNLGSREVVAPAIKSGQIDLYIGYAATDLEYYNKGAGEATGDATATTAKLNSRLQSISLVALTPSAAVDQNAFAVTKATQQKYSLAKLSDLQPVAGQLVLGAGPECPTRPYCLPG